MLFRLTAYLLAPFYLAALLWRGRGQRGAWSGLGQRFGLGAALPAPLWLHAASAGEVQAAAVLVAALRQRYPQLPLLVTATTAAGRLRARTLFELQSVEVRYLPLDLPGAVRRFLQRVRPRRLLVLETEIWPNLIRACDAAGIPVMFVSARLSARSARRYRRLGTSLRPLLATVAQVAAQTAQDAQRFAQLGVPADRIRVTGNLKADFSVPAGAVGSGARLRAALGSARPVWVAGSTHEHEERQVLQAHRAVCRAQPAALLILVPRHPRRFDAVADWLAGEQVTFARQSRGDAVTAASQVLLVDAMGLLLECYAAADVTFVGGSLVGVGGHNLLEPAALGRAILTGPHHANAPEILHALLEAQALRVVRDGAELGQAVTALLQDAAARERMAARGLQVVSAGRGACARVLALLPADPTATAAPDHP
ncbi:MAG TPA: lipid IV(A) 3-deoxy-D-manno-octulosonic acid transferase [Steroidobacteraceae bacterium]|nr:lipid IV(A) 3-deoxy-D-manno-octulosonic acid transferase [Steroidobacteraceae bacterium]